MNDAQIVNMGKRAAECYKLAQELENKIDIEIVKKLGYKDLDDFQEKTGCEYENDIIIDSLHHEHKFSTRTLRMAIGFARGYRRQVI